VSPHLSRQRAEEYRQRVLPEAELLAVDNHLATCEECRQRIGANIEIEAVVSDFHRRLVSDVDALESDHLSYEQLVTLVDDELKQNERDALQIHMEVCNSCVEEVNELRAFRAELLRSTVKETVRAVKPSFSEKIRSLIDSQRLSFRHAFAGALALLLIAASVVLFLAWRASRRSQPVLQATNPVPEVSPEANSPNVATAPSPSLESTPDEHFVVTLNDGGKRVTVDVNGNVEGLAPLPRASSQVVRRTLTTGKVAVPDLSELIGIKGRLMGTSSDRHAFSLTYPVGTVTRNTRPTLRWRPLTGTTSYTVAILDGSYNVVTTSPPLTTTSWTPTVELDRGRVYLWQVTSLKDGQQHLSPVAPEPEARFKVLDKTTVDELISVEKTGNSHLVRGTMYARAGLLDEAEKELRALLAANPNSKIARALLQSVRAKRQR
jgi:anti-sigma factor ChrR (cupin superfamily)